MKRLTGLDLPGLLNHRPLVAIYTELSLALLARAESTAHPDERRRWAEEAAQACRGGLREQPELAPLNLYLARAYDLQGITDETVRLYLEAARAEPKAFMALALDAVRRLLTATTATSLASLLTWFGEAERDMLSPALAAAAGGIYAYSLLRLEDYTQAAHRFQQALDRPDLDSELHMALSEGLSEALVRDRTAAGRSTRRERAAALLADICQQVHEQDDPTREVRAMVLRIETLIDLTRYDETLELIAEALALEAGYVVELHLAQARCLYERGEQNVAATIVESQLKNLADLPAALQADTLALNACLYYDQGDYAPAIEAADTARDRVPDHPLALSIGAQARLALDTKPAADSQSTVTPTVDQTEVAIRLLQRYAHADPEGAARVAPTIARQSELAAAEMECARLEELHTQGAATADELGMAHYTAGRRRNWRQHYSAAIDHFEQARSLLPAYQPTYWYLANSLIFESLDSRPERSVSVEERVAQARAMWEAGIALGPVDAEFKWAYYTMTVICDSEANLPKYVGQRTRYWFEGLTWCETGLLQNENDLVTRTFTVRLYRYLEFDANALAISDTLREHNKDVFSLDERSAILANTGRFTEAAEVVKQRLSLAPNAWATSVLAFVYYYLRRYDEALQMFSDSVTQGIDEIWVLNLVAACYRRLGNVAEARKRYEAIWNLHDQEQYRVNIDLFASAAYALGAELGSHEPLYLKQAAEILEEISDNPDFERGDTRLTLGEIYLALGDERALPIFAEGINAIKDRWVLERTRNYNLDELRVQAASWKHRTQAVRVIDQAAKLLDARLATFAEPTPEEELRDALTNKTIAAIDFAQVAIKASLARILREQQRWAVAGALYHELLKGGVFAEASTGLKQCIEHMLAQGDERLKVGDTLAAEDIFTQIESLRAALPVDTAAQLDLSARRGLAAFARGEEAAAQSHFGAALAATAASGTALANALCPRIYDTAQYWALTDALEGWEADPDTDSELGGKFAEVRRGLAAYLDMLVSAGKDQLLIPVVTPVVFELSDALVPFVDSRQDGGAFLYEMIPAMRDSITNDTGVRLPGVRARGNPGLPPGAYEMQLDEVPVSSGVALLGYWYFDSTTQFVERLHIGAHGISTTHPVSGAPGYWLDEAGRTALEAAGQSALSTPQYLIAHIDAVLRRNLARFVGIQETESLLAEWEKRPGGKELVASALPGPLARLRLTWLLKSLLTEGVPIVDWESILTATAELDMVAAPLSTLVRAARLRLRPRLPGNRPGVARFTLPPVFEKQLLGYRDGRPLFAAGPAQKHEVLLWLREQMASTESPAALVTRSYELRPLLRRLVEPEFPNLAVMAEEELLTPDQWAPALPSTDPAVATGFTDE